MHIDEDNVDEDEQCCDASVFAKILIKNPFGQISNYEIMKK